jgi:predicted nucleotidyltransferase
MKTNTASNLVKYIHEHKQATPKELGGFLGISRQALFKHISKLLTAGKLVKVGRSPKVFYRSNVQNVEAAKAATFTKEEIARIIRPVLKSYNVSKASLFGSVARGEAGKDSDVDLVIKLGKMPFGIWGFVGLKQDLEKALQKKVDVISESALNKELEKKIKTDLTTIYERV